MVHSTYLKVHCFILTVNPSVLIRLCRGGFLARTFITKLYKRGEIMEMKKVNMIVDRAYQTAPVDERISAPLLNTWEELYMEEFISQSIPRQMRTASAKT